jgi:hypothetical protein
MQGETVPGIGKGDTLQRLAGISFIVGAIAVIVAGLVHPRLGDRTDLVAVIQKIADTNGGFWEFDHFLITVGIWAWMIGFVGVYRSISAGGAAAWARLGFYGALVGTTLFTVFFAFDGMGLAVVAEQWEEAAEADKATLLLVATALDGFLDGMRFLTGVAYWLALVFLAIGMVLSNLYPKWLGWAILIVSAVMVVNGLVGVAGLTNVALLMFVAVLPLTSVWALVAGIWITLKAW